MARKVKDKGNCAMPSCTDPASVAGMCSACYSWWGRVSNLSAGEFSGYLTRSKYRYRRMSSRLENVGSGWLTRRKPVRRAA